MEPAETLPPEFAVGEYRIERLLGQGGMGEVYAAVQPEIGARVAVKVLGRELSRDPRLVRRFIDEARAVNKIRHPNIIHIFAFGRLPDGREYFVMEYLEGETLAARLERGPLPVADARRLLLQICEALEAAHAENVVHRDLKPENLWIATPRHGQAYAKVLDFGIAKLVENRDTPLATEMGVAMGTPFYMSPEQCQGEAVDHRTDIYAMGVLLYFMWSGRLPFEGSTFLAVVSQQVTATPAPPSTHRPVPPALERLILSCLEKDPARRPQSARALAAALDAALATMLPGETLPPVRSPGGHRGPPTSRPPVAVTHETGPFTPAPAAVGATRGSRSAARIVAVSIALVLLAGGGIWLARRAGPTTNAPARPASTSRTTVAPAPAPTAPIPPPPARNVATVPAPAAPTPTPKPAPARVRDKRATETRVERPARPAEERGFAKENPFR